MSRTKILLVLIFIPVLALFSYKATFSFFSNQASSINNIFAASSAFPTPTPTPGPPIATTLVVNEFLWNSSCGNNASQQATNYWIELYNGSSVVIDLKNWRFRDGSGNTIQISNAQKLLNTSEYMIITKDGSVFTGCYILQGSPQTANLGGNSDFLPATTGGVIRLEKPDPDNAGQFIIVDRVEYGPTLNSGALDPPVDKSIGRHPNAIDTMLGDTFAVGDFQNETTITPGVSNP